MTISSHGRDAVASRKSVSRSLASPAAFRYKTHFPLLFR
jgi:hypothetical protein